MRFQPRRTRGPTLWRDARPDPVAPPAARPRGATRGPTRGATRGPTPWRDARPDPVARRAAASYQGGMHDVAGGDHAERAGVVAHDEPRVRIEIEGDAIESAVG